MGTIKYILFIPFVAVIILISNPSWGQFLSNLDATGADALFTTYAAPQSRSSYTIDQGYHLRFRLNKLFHKPVITISYSDLVAYYYYPFRDIRVEVLFDVYSSQEAIADIRIKNEGVFPAEFNAAPYLYYPSVDTLNDFAHQSPFDFYSFPAKKNRDSWMKEHSIPLTEDMQGFIAGNIRFDSTLSFVMGRCDTPQQNSRNKEKDILYKYRQGKKHWYFVGCLND